jgi:hypothetical protein
MVKTEIAENCLYQRFPNVVIVNVSSEFHRLMAVMTDYKLKSLEQGS